MPRRGSAQVRADQLKDALRTMRATKGNHTIDVIQGLLRPEKNLCAPCNLNMICYLQGKQVDYVDAVCKDAPCVLTERSIKFLYHGTTCLVYLIGESKISDYGMWGYSASTRQAIGTYLHALWVHNFLTGGSEQVAYLKQCFKKLYADKNIGVVSHYVKEIITEENDINDPKHNRYTIWLHLA